MRVSCHHHPAAWPGSRSPRNQAGELLLIEKKDRSAYPERWGLPGGFAEQGEAAPMACQRRVLAQTGLHILPTRLLVVHHMPAEEYAWEGTTHIFDGELTTGKITLADDSRPTAGFGPTRWGAFSPHMPSGASRPRSTPWPAPPSVTSTVTQGVGPPTGWDARATGLSCVERQQPRRSARSFDGRCRATLNLLGGGYASLISWPMGGHPDTGPGRPAPP